MIHPNELDQQIENLRTLQQSYDQIGTAAEAYNVGKTQLAAAITSKGVETSPTETYPEMADHVRNIQQTQTIIDGGDMYAAQLTGDGVLWNLYAVLADMKSRFMGTDQYACLIVCEYYKGYDSLQLQGADAYYTCDGYLYEYASKNHVWHDANNGKMNRWVAFLYRDEGARLEITNTAISPRSIYIGGHIGTIEYFVNSRLTDFVCGVEETDVLDNFAQKSFTQSFSQSVVLRNIKNYDHILVGNVVNFCLETDSLKIGNYDNVQLVVGAQYVNIKQTGDIYVTQNRFVLSCRNAIGVIVEGGTIRVDTKSFFTPGGLPEARYIYIDGFIGGVLFPSDFGAFPTTELEDLLIGEAQQNIDTRMWSPTNVLTDAGRKARLVENIKNHILARVSNATGGTQLVFTVSTNMYNEVASETIEWQGETMSLADAFLTKNWLLAGA